MGIDFSNFDKPRVLDYEPAPPPPTWRDWLTDLPGKAIEEFGGPTFCMFIGGLLLMTAGMLIGSTDAIGMKIYAAGFAIVGLLFSLWTMK